MTKIYLADVYDHIDFILASLDIVQCHDGELDSFLL